MSSKALQIAGMLDILPEDEQNLALMLLQRLILAWDPDYTKLTASERNELEEAETGIFFDEEEIDWNNLEKYIV